MSETTGRSFEQLQPNQLAELLAAGLSDSGEGKTHGANEVSEQRRIGDSGRGFADCAPAEFPGYALLECIHHGGQGIVYRAIQESTKREVAIKVVREGPFATRVEQARLQREAEVLGQLRHPNIVAIHDSGTVAGCFYLVMDYIAGQPLDVWLIDGPRPRRALLELFARICDAVAAAHLRGIIHRDLKPGNIRVTTDSEPFVLDFGLAKPTPQGHESLRTMTIPGQFMGSLPWASPEQALGHPERVDVRSDVYALGVVLYQMLTGGFPYEVVGSAPEVLYRIIHAEPRRPSAGDGPVDAELETIILKCLQKEPERRYQSAGELARDIHRYLHGEPIEAKRDSLAYVLRKRLHRYRLGLGVAATFVALLTTACILVLGLYRQAHAAAEDLRRAAYIHKINLAQAAWEDGRPRVMKELLYACPAELRGWEWAHLAACADQSLRRLRGHTGWIVSAALTRDGRRLVTGSHDRTIRMWDLESGSTVWMHGLATRVEGVTLSPDDRLVASVTHAGVIQVWAADDGHAERTLAAGAPEARHVVFSPDGRWLASVQGEGVVAIWDTRTWERATALPQHPSLAVSAAFTPDGQLVLFGDDQPPVTWTLPNGPSQPFLPCVESSLAPVFSPDGRYFALGHADGFVDLYDSMTGASQWPQPGPTSPPRCLAFSSDGRVLATGSQDGAIRLWEAATGGLLRTLWGHEFPVTSVGFCASIDRMQLVSTSEDQSIRLWSASAAPPFWANLRSSGPVAFLPDGERLVCHDRDAQGIVVRNALRDAVSERQLRRSRGFSLSAISPDGRWVGAFTREQLAILDTQVDQPGFTACYGGYPTMAFSADSQRIAFPRADNVVEIRKPDGEMPALSIDSRGSQVKSLTFSPDGCWLAVGCADGKVQLWDWRTQQLATTLAGHAQAVRALAFSPDGRWLATGGNDCALRVWGVTGSWHARWAGRHDYDVHQLAFTPDGRRVVSASYGSAKLWDASTGVEIMTFPFGPTEQVWVAVSPVGDRIALSTSQGIEVRATTGADARYHAAETAYLLARTALEQVARGQAAQADPLFEESLGIFSQALVSADPVQTVEISQDVAQLLTQLRALPKVPQTRAWQAKLNTLSPSTVVVPNHDELDHNRWQ